MTADTAVASWTWSEGHRHRYVALTDRRLVVSGPVDADAARDASEARTGREIERVEPGEYPARVDLRDVWRVRLDPESYAVRVDLVDGVTTQVVRPPDRATAEAIFTTLHARLAPVAAVTQRLPARVTPAPAPAGASALLRAIAAVAVLTSLYTALWSADLAGGGDGTWVDRLTAAIGNAGPEPVLYGLVVMAALAIAHIVHTGGGERSTSPVARAPAPTRPEVLFEVPYLDAIRPRTVALPADALTLTVDGDVDPLADLL